MRRTVILLAVLGLALAACSRETGSGRSWNPATWFDGRDIPDTLIPVEQRLSTDNRLLVEQITDVAIERTPGGVIILATGLPPTQGFWQTGLVLDRVDGEPLDGTLSYQFRIAPPLTNAPTQEGRVRTDTNTAAGSPSSGGISFGGSPQNAPVPQTVSRPAGTPETREVTAAIFLTNQQLEGVSEVQIIAERNARTLRR
ncbi:MAG: hypothetical protein HRU32_05465 [Rhodobacteraceae bacterium]|nr:hypothetical protein [Paracoccaceae bacterium]